jgi:hypothetical protein
MEPGYSSLPNSITDLVASGQCFWYKTALGGVAAAAVGVNSAPFIWNPAGSGVRLRILKVKFGIVSGAGALQHLAYGLLSVAGAQIETAQPIVSYTPGAAVNANINKGLPSVMNFCPLTTTMIAGPAYLMPNGLSTIGALAAGVPVKLVDEVNGEIIINPGDAFFPLIAGGTITLTLAVAVLGWEEVIPSGGAR